MRLLHTEYQAAGASHARYFLWEVDGGQVESSLLYLSARSYPWVVCLPSAIGCSNGCKICAMPRNRSPQPLEAQQLSRITAHALAYVSGAQGLQISFMGQGEPLEHTGHVFEFCHQFLHRYPRSKVGISTVGVERGIKALETQEWAGAVKLQLSLHAWPSRKRAYMVPAETRFPFRKAFDAAISLQKIRGTSCNVNCVLLDGINDADHDAMAVADLIKGTGFYAKISRFNPFQGSPYSPASLARFRRFLRVLAKEGVDAHEFSSIGTSIGVGCGQTRLIFSEPRRADYRSAERLLNGSP